jgi:hypothetical protein
LLRIIDMARARDQENGRLQETLAALQQNLIALQRAQLAAEQTTAIFVQSQAAFVAQMGEMREREDRRWAETLERFARIEAILLEHSRILKALPDAVREKIGFRPPGQPS